MHTSQALRSSHFQYWRIGAGGRARVAFRAFCASYHEQDRVGVVSPRLEDGILHTGYALLALTTAFYDAQRARGGDFFIYPQHFAILSADRSGVATRAGRLDLTLDEDGIGGAWGWLDVWPASNWLTAPGAPAAMLRTVFDFQINQLFWPHDFKAGHRSGHRPAPSKLSGPQAPGQQPTNRQDRANDALPDYARRILKSRLKSVYYYNAPAPTIEIRAAQPAAEIVQASIGRLPAAARRTLAQTQEEAHPCHESYRQVSVDDFLNDMEPCFVPAAPGDS